MNGPAGRARGDTAGAGRPADGTALIVFDGTCLLCSRWVRFLLRVDRRARYRFAPMQAPPGRALLRRHGLDPDDPLSLLLLDGGRAWTDSDAVLRVLTGLGGGWRLLGVLRGVPRGLRDAGYRWLARNRHRWFGTSSSCSVPDAAQRARFLE